MHTVLAVLDAVRAFQNVYGVLRAVYEEEKRGTGNNFNTILIGAENFYEYVSLWWL